MHVFIALVIVVGVVTAYKEYYGRFTESKECAGFLQSPRFPYKYHSGDTGRYKIEAPLHNQVTLKVQMLQIASNSDCSTDAVYIYDGLDTTAPLIARICGQTSNKEFHATANKMYVHFKTGSRNTNGYGFQFIYYSSPMMNRFNAGTRCRGKSDPILTSDCPDGYKYFSSTSGQVQPAGFPTKPQKDKHCLWLIDVSAVGNQIRLSWSQWFNIEGTENCDNKFAFYIPSARSNRPPFCQSSPKPAITITNGPYMFLTLQTAKRTRSRGFSVSYQAKGSPQIINQYFEYKPGSGDNGPPPPPTRRTTATHRPTTRRPTTRRPTTQKPTTRRLTTRRLTTRKPITRSTPPGQTTTWPNDARTYQIKCGNLHASIADVKAGYITSPGFGRQYPNNCEGSYMLKSSSVPKRYKVTADEFAVDSSQVEGCADSLTIYQKNPKVTYGPYCGQNEFGSLSLITPVEFKFKSDDAARDSGFKLKFREE